MKCGVCILGLSFCLSLPCRWGNTPLDEALMCGNKNLIKLLEDAKSAQLSEFSHPSSEFTGIDNTVLFFFYSIELGNIVELAM